ncbi:hypothetical protein [Spirobacillus cienkowskii]|uniref:hypothetical protein n=1 Tax=Spirobacillus cienkowskii TaxID=495820 RepID=UPI0030CDE679
MEIILSEKCFNDFIKLIYELTGITIGHNRNSMVESRLRKRLIALKLTSCSIAKKGTTLIAC